MTSLKGAELMAALARLNALEDEERACRARLRTGGAEARAEHIRICSEIGELRDRTEWYAHRSKD
jgi:hypothetical protein